MSYDNWGRLLSARFPNRHSPESEQSWVSLKERLLIGQPVTGAVIAKAPFGAWVDIGVGFPALLEIITIAGLTPERYRNDDWCPIGSEVTAVVFAFNDRNRQVSLSQVKRPDIASNHGSVG